MNKIYFSLFFLIFISVAMAQNTFTIKGKIADENQKNPLESATVYITSQKDSTVIDYTISSKNGTFEFKTRKSTQPFFLKVSFLGYQNLTREFPSITSDIDLGLLLLKELDTNLDEVVLKAEAPPIRIKNDTLEFDAASFKVGPDANVEKLLKQLPGVEITPEGKITVNGKEVNQILVNGKPFFGKDGKIATQNLPAEIIEKIQVVDTKTKEEELSGDSATSENKTINLTIQEDKNKGFFGKVMGGYGSDERYESSLLLNSFKGEQKLSVLASSNNINSVGFSMNEIFDNMGGGRNTSVYYNDNGTFGINGMSFGGGTGITASNLIGINYVDKWKEKVDFSSNYYFNNAETDNVNRTERTNLLPTGTTFTESESTSSRLSNAHNVGLDFEIKIDSLSTISFTPKFSLSKTKNRAVSDQTTVDEMQNLLNESNSTSFTENENRNFENAIYYYRSFKKKGRAMTFSFDHSHTQNDDASTISSGTFFQGTLPDDIRNQNQITTQRYNSARAEIRFGEPITDSLKLSLTSEIKYRDSNTKLATFDFDEVSNSYSDFNAPLSNEIFSKRLSYFPSAGLNLQKKNFRARFNIGPEFVAFRNTSDYLSVTTQLNRNYVFPKVTSNLNYTLSKTKSIYGQYNYSVNLPEANQILPVENLSNPLNTLLGNANLKPTRSHGSYLSFNNYDWASRSGYFLYSGITFNTDNIVASTVYDENFKATTTYENVDRNISSYLGFNFSKSYKKEKRTFRFSAGIDGGYTFSQGLTNAELFEAKSWRMEPKVNFSWSIEGLVTVAPSYRYSFNTTDFTNYVIENANNFTHNFKMEFTSYWPKNLVFGNDFGYTYNSNIASGFQKDFYLWNSSLGYNFFNDKLLAKVKVYDMLNQNLGVRRTITPTAITDTENTVLRRYVMFSLTYKLEKFGGKKKEEGGIFFMD
jgi:hypothetical protein